ncbi:MAG: hypothetical protein EON93_02530 [Burkholderiales bacterium]|nr:MAG: hypothetical protein EON93_02530 [Burkholderiales bacterium]
MTEPQRIAAIFANDLDGGGAALLVAICENDGTAAAGDDLGYVRELEAAGCLLEGKLTVLGMRVALVLQAQHGVTRYGRDK